MLFGSWKEMFKNGNGANLNGKKVYSFAGRDILTDKRWYAFS